jgi:hypothetical protein
MPPELSVRSSAVTKYSYIKCFERFNEYSRIAKILSWVCQ